MMKETRDSICQTYIEYPHDFGVPEHLTFDGATVRVGKNTLFVHNINMYDSKYHASSQSIPNYNLA